MLVLTVDQVDSRHRGDRVVDVVGVEGQRRPDWARAALLGPDRTAGDEFQVLFDSPEAALEAGLELLRSGDWSVGLGVGRVAAPLPATTREATGTAFVSARAAVTAAKHAPHRFAIVAEGAPEAASGLGALIDLLLEVRARRSAEGWEAMALLAAGSSQAAIASRLGISPQAVSLRLKAAGARLELRATPALVGLVAALDADVGGAT